MRKRRLISRAMFIGGTVALLAGPAWSQEAPGERRQPDRSLTTPGDKRIFRECNRALSNCRRMI